jgi:hypothetical protein
MPVCQVYMGSAVEGGVCVPAVRVSVSLLSRCRYSGLAGRTSHELEGHGHALLIVRHVCGISRGVDWSGVGGGVAAGWSACWSSMRSRWLSQGRRRRRRKPGGTCRIRFALSGELRLQQARTGACYTIEPNPQTLSPHNSTHTMSSTRAFNMLRQRAMPAFRAQQPVRGLRLQASPKMKMPVPVSLPRIVCLCYILISLQKEEHSG